GYCVAVNRVRSSRIRPLAWSTSYLLRLPLGISMSTSNTAGPRPTTTASPMRPLPRAWVWGLGSAQRTPLGLAATRCGGCRCARVRRALRGLIRDVGPCPRRRSRAQGRIVNTIIVVSVIILVVLVVAAIAVRIIKQYERGVLFRFGRVLGARDPGLRLIVPIVDVLHRESMRIVTMPIQSQGIITRDN